MTVETLFNQSAFPPPDIYIPKAAKGTKLTPGKFGLVLWQPNPYQPSGLLVEQDFQMGQLTGLTVFTPFGNYQRAFRNQPGTTTAQAEGLIVGAYLDSKDLPAAPPNSKMMITPQYTFANPEPIFKSPTAELRGSMSLQVAVASGDSYANVDHLFINGDTRISFSVKLFSNGSVAPIVGIGQDPDTGGYMLNSPLGLDETYVTAIKGAVQTIPWRNFRYFSWTVSYAQFDAALKALTRAFPGAIKSLNPADWNLAELHLNAELFFGPSVPAILGWSMHDWMATLAI
jgi:hypothetical protein